MRKQMEVEDVDINVEMNSTVNEAQKDSRGFSLPKKDTGICSFNKELLKRKYNLQQRWQEIQKKQWESNKN